MSRSSRHPRRKSKVARLISATVLTAALAAGFFLVNGEASQRADALTTSIGLVNEDLAAVFNGTEYTFGSNFVDRISKDSEYNWTVLSRSVAEKSYRDGSLDAVIYLPQSFSRDILTLQELDPTKATVEFKLRHQVDDRADRILENKVVSVVSGFNEGVVKMYYASLADNIAEADGQMYESLSNQEALIKAFTADVQEPFSQTMQDFKNFVESTDSLKTVNAATTEAQNSFTESVTEQLARTGEMFAGKLPEISEYTKRQQEIANINVANSNQGIADQAASDRDFYGTQFGSLRTNTLCRLSGLDADDAAQPCTDENGNIAPDLRGQLTALHTAVDTYTAPVTTVRADAAALRPELDAHITDLELFLEPYLEPTTPETPTEPEEPGSTEPEEPGGTEPEEPTPPAIPLAPEVLETLQKNLDALKQARTVLVSAEELPATEFGSYFTGLDTWYTETLEDVKDAALSTSEVRSLEVKDWSTRTADDNGVYVDSSDTLQSSITDLVTTSAEASHKISESKLTVPDNSGQFDALLKRANTTYDGATNVLDGANGLLDTGNTTLGENQQYYASFSTVLANTRTQGVDTGKINEFFAAPIDAKNITPARVPVTDTFDPQLLLIFGGGLLAGVLVMVIGGFFRRKKEA